MNKLKLYQVQINNSIHWIWCIDSESVWFASAYNKRQACSIFYRELWWYLDNEYDFKTFQADLIVADENWMVKIYIDWYYEWEFNLEEKTLELISSWVW